ncbi:MAG: asparagine synthase (glutamine-hydrolyzing) [Deltaproteobacteria bacterium]|nr:asparagine synthase (glutamine-hydrolyzing) [Deltaproteobacteria bacterium]
MCGICGEIDFNNGVRVESVRQMTNVLAHRGPDDEGMVFIKDGHVVEIKKPFEIPLGRNGFEVGLGHRRLSIIDLSAAAHQPMCNENGTIWIVYNGEIYNFQILRKELEQKGHSFKSNSDTEAILHAYEEWGVECLNYFRGMFAIAIWDSKLQRLFMARDRLGKKPLVYFHQNGYFAFASEIKALLQLPTIEKRVSGYAIHDYLTYQYVPSPDTIFEGIKKLPPAHYLLYDHNKGIRIERYWRLHFNEKNRNDSDLGELQDRIRTGLEESVKLRLISDVPLGAFLSGGIDSSLIVGIMAMLSGKPVKTFSIGFEEKDFDELDYARIVSNHFSTEHHEFIVQPDAIEILPKLAWYYNEPFADSSAIPTYYVARMTKDYVKVVLTGDAGDENFAGYPRYLRSKWLIFFLKLPKVLRSNYFPLLLRMIAQFHWREKTFNRMAAYVESLSSNQARNYAEQVKIINAGEKEGLYSPEFMEAVGKMDSFDYLINKFNETEADDLIEQLLYLDINTYLPEDLLVKMDIATMANSLEARVPFLDHQFMEFIATVPPRLKLKGTISKYILKQAFSDFLPQSVIQRKKMGFGVPVARWFRNELKNYIFEILLDSRTLNRGYFRREGIERLLNEHIALTYDHSSKIWALLFLEIWFRVFMDEKDVVFTSTV